MTERELSLRERTRQAVRAEITDAAMSLFLSGGFEATTIDDIARAAGISRRSYFRYFATKDEVLEAGLTAIGAVIGSTLSERPRDEPLWTALRRAFDPLIAQASADPNGQALGRLMLERPALQQGKDIAWQAEIAAALADRMPAAEDDSPLRAEAIASAAIACLHVAQARWLREGENRGLGILLDTTMGAVHALP